MNEFLDYYDEDGNFQGTASREEVHKEGLWHNTVHCWLYTKDSNVMFQIRKDTNTFYTTASGHVSAGETIKEAFKREIKEEIGLDLDTDNATLVDIVTWKMDKVKKDGTLMKDRAKANVYINLYEGDYTDFNFDKEEVLGIASVNAQEALKLFNDELTEIEATIIDDENILKRMVTKDDFLLNEGETLISKYGPIINKVIEQNK